MCNGQEIDIGCVQDKNKILSLALIKMQNGVESKFRCKRTLIHQASHSADSMVKIMPRNCVKDDDWTCAMRLRRTFLVDQNVAARREWVSSRSNKAYLPVLIACTNWSIVLPSPSAAAAAAEADFFVESTNTLCFCCYKLCKRCMHNSFITWLVSL